VGPDDRTRNAGRGRARTTRAGARVVTCVALLVGAAAVTPFPARPGPGPASTAPARTQRITLTPTPHGVITPVRLARVETGDSAAFLIRPDRGYHVARLLVDGHRLPARTRFVFRDVRAPHTLAADFDPDVYQVSVDAGPHGTFSPARARYVLHGRDVTLRIVPQPGFHLESLSVDGEPARRTDALVLHRVTAPHQVAATFEADGYVIQASADPHAHITPAGDVAVAFGETRTFRFSAEPGDTLRELWVDGKPEPVGTMYTFSNVHGPHRIEVRTARHVATVTAPAPGEWWLAGEERLIRWQPLASDLADSAEVSVSLHGADGPWSSVWSGLLREGSAPWRVPGVDCDSLVVRVAADSGGVTLGMDLSTGFVTVRADAADPSGRRFYVRAVPSPATLGPVRLDYALPMSGEAALEIFSVGGRQVWRHSLGVAPVGERSANWDGRLPNGSQASPGVYFARLVTPNGERRCRLILLP